MSCRLISGRERSGAGPTEGFCDTRSRFSYCSQSFHDQCIFGVFPYQG